MLVAGIPYLASDRFTAWSGNRRFATEGLSSLPWGSNRADVAQATDERSRGQRLVAVAWGNCVDAYSGSDTRIADDFRRSGPSAESVTVGEVAAFPRERTVLLLPILLIPFRFPVERRELLYTLVGLYGTRLTRY